MSGAGLFLNTRAARSNVEPWHGHRKPPGQSPPHGRVGHDELGRRRAAQVRADTDTDQVFRLDRTIGTLDVGGLVCVSRFRIGKQRGVFLQLGQLLLGTTDDPDGLAAPLHGHHFARLQLADIGFDRRAGRLGPFGWRKARHKRNRRTYTRCSTNDSSGNQQVTAAAVGTTGTGFGAGRIRPSVIVVAH